MRKIRKKKFYSLDSSAIIHLASMSKTYTNTFRLSVILKERISPVILKNALHNITPRFPTIVAGIKRGLFHYYIAPVEKTPQIQQDKECLAYMSRDMIEKCAIRILYSDYQISIEIFHSLTDGYGGMVFLKSLVAEYLVLRYSISIPYSDEIFNPSDEPKQSEIVDDYITYKGKNAVSVKYQNTYQPSFREDSIEVITKKGIYNTQKILDKAHIFGASITTFLTSVMAKALLELQNEHMDGFQKQKQPIQIMVPINLRHKFSSKTLRNFSIYALPCLMPMKEKIDFGDLVNTISEQMKQQLSEKQLKGMMTTNVNSQNLLFFNILPLTIKDVLLRLVFHFYGERNSCITISNLGEITFPDEMKPYVKGVDILLSPRKFVPYNCSVISFNGELHINFTKKSNEYDLEKKFFEIINNIV